MAPKLNENFTEFPERANAGPISGPWYAFWKRFFKTPDNKPLSSKPPAKSGDSIKTVDNLDRQAKKSSASSWITQGVLEMPPVERKRRDRYRTFESMEAFPEISSAFDIYSDDATQEDIDGKVFKINTSEQIIKDEFKDFVKNTKLDFHIWDIARNVVKYGDCFVELVLDLEEPEMGIQRIKILNPNFLYRVEDSYGNLVEYIQQVPTSDFEASMPSAPDPEKLVKLTKEQIAHFRRRTSDADFYPYGKGIAAPAIATFRSLRLMEDAMIIYRLARAPERRVFKIEVGNLPATKVEAYMEKVKEKYKKEKFYDSSTGTLNARYNPETLNEDFFVPVKNGKGADIVPLPGAQNLGDIDDVRYWRDKVLAAMKVPKDFIVEKDKSPERKANLSQLDVKFSKAVSRVQKDLKITLGEVFRTHLALKGYPLYLYDDAEIELCPPSDMHEKRRLEIDEQKTRVVQAIQGLALFPKEYIYKTYFGLSDQEIMELMAQMKKQMKEEGAQNPGMPMPGMPPGGPGMPPPGMDPNAPPNASAEIGANAGAEAGPPQ
jgi:hypothetical protein